MSKEREKSGCIGTMVKLAIVLFVIGAIASVVMPKSGSPTEANPENAPVAEGRQSENNIAAESSREAGYNDGFIVGQARYNNKEAGLDPSRIALLSRINSESHAEGGKGRSAASYRSGWKRGYADGFAGKSRGGAEQEPLPQLPISISREPKYSYKNLNNTKANAPLEQLALLAKEGAERDLFIVDAKVVLNENSTELVRLLYDRKERIYLKLTRLILLGEESSAEWVLKIDISEDELNETNLWDTDAKHRTVRSKFNDAKTSVPLIYTQNRKFTEWP